jgi:arylsulfatase A-like enzyme
MDFPVLKANTAQLISILMRPLQSIVSMMLQSPRICLDIRLAVMSFALLVGSCLTLEAAERPNIVFIEVDDLCYRYASPWGSKTSVTPTLDRLASEGFVFDQAMCQGMMCGPSRNSLISGKYPHQLGLYQNGDLRKLPEKTWTLPKALQKSGYRTVWIGKSHLKPYFSKKSEGDTFKPFFGFDHALHTLGRAIVGGDDDSGEKGDGPNPYMEHLEKRGKLAQYKADAEAKRNSTLPEDDYLDGWFTKPAENYISSYRSEKPLFLWVNYSVPHGPYDVADPYHVPFEKKVMPGVSKPTKFVHPESLIRRTKTVRNEKHALEEQRGFHANIHFMDTQVKRLLTALESKKILDNAWIVFFSDQGVMEGAHGLVHKHTFFRQITQPSLIIRAPQGNGGGKRIAQPVELMDLLPTFLEIGGVTGEKAPNGMSLTPLLQGKSFNRPYVFGEIEEWCVVSDGRYRLIRSEKGEGSFLFDDAADPENLTNIADKNPDTVKSLGAAIDHWLNATGPRLPSKSM